MAASKPETRSNPRRRLLRALVVSLFAVLAVGFAATPAQAHATLEGTDPTPGSIVETAPAAVMLKFSEHVQPVTDHIKVIAPNGSNVVKGTPNTTQDGAWVRIELNSGLAQGTYLVSYRIISADGHPVSGSMTFSIVIPSTLGASKSSVENSGATVDGAVRIVQSAGRYLAYAGIALLAGPLVILLELWPRRLDSRGPRRLAWIGWALLTLGTLDVLVLEQPYADGNSITTISLNGIGDTLDSTPGKALLTRVALMVAAVPLLLRILRAASPAQEAGAGGGRVDRILAVLFGAAVLVTFPFAGHGAQSPAPYVSIPAITLHVGSMAIWLGGLVVLARYLLPRVRFRELAVIMPVWSRWAFLSVAVLVFSGSVETLLEIGGFSHLDYLVTTTYGQLVLTKAIWLGAILVVAASARAWVRQRFGVPVAYAMASDESSDEEGKAPAERSTSPAEETARTEKAMPSKKAASAEQAVKPGKKAALPRRTAAGASTRQPSPNGVAVKEPDGGAVKADFSAAGKAADEVRRLRSRVAIEVVLGAVVLALATALVQVAPARNAGEAAALARSLPYSAQITLSRDLIVQVDISPAKVGTDQIHLTAFDSAGLPATVAEWDASADLNSENLTSQVALTPISQDHAIGQVDLPYAGAWKFTFTLRISDFDEETAVRTVNVR